MKRIIALLVLLTSVNACTSTAPSQEALKPLPCTCPDNPPPTSDFTPPGKQVPITPSTLASLQSVGAGNTAVMAAGTYTGFNIPAGVSVYSPVIGAAVVNGTLRCVGKCDVIGLTINGGQVDLTGNDGSRVARNTFKGGFNRGDIFGTGAIYAEGGKNLIVDHNHFENIATTVLTWSVDNLTMHRNEFINVTQGIDCEFSQAGHGNHTYTENYFSGLKRMAIECGTGGNAVALPAFHDVILKGNYAENFNWPTGSEGNVVYSIVGSNGGTGISITGNYGVGTGANSIGIEMNAEGIVSGNYVDKQGYSCVEVYGRSGFTVKDNSLTNCGMVIVGNYSNGSGVITNNSATVKIPKPVTGPMAR